SSSSVSTDGAISLTVTGGVLPYSYSWSNGASSSDLSELTAGTYIVNIKDANGCITSGTFKVASLTGISNVNADVSGMMIYPNPSNEMATIEMKGSIISNIKIVNVNGQVVFELEPKLPKVQINSNTLASGIYFVEVLVDGNFVTRRMIV